MLLELFRWLQGYVRFRIIGKYPERFINIVTKNGLNIWHTDLSNGEMTACMYLGDYRGIRALCRKSSVRLRVISKHGFPFFVRKYKPRVGVLLGFLIFCLFVYFMSNFVWVIDISGLETISEAQLMSQLESSGLYIGTYKPKANFKSIERDVMLNIDDIGWMAVNVQGSYASVEVKEKAKSPDVPDYKKPANVKACRDGLILSITTSQGEALFEAGSAVVKDQLLVGCVVEDKLGGVSFVRADAEVIAQTDRKLTFTVDKTSQMPEFSEPRLRADLVLFGCSVPALSCFACEGECAVRFSERRLNLFGTVLPVGVSDVRLYSTEVFSRKLSEQKAQLCLSKQCALYECFELSECKILSKETELSQDNDRFVLNVSYTCEEDIAYQQEVNIDKLRIENFVRKDDEQK